MIERIKEKARAVKISIRKLEREANVGENTIYRWDTYSPSIDKVQRVASVLGCTVDDLIREEQA